MGPVGEQKTKPTQHTVKELRGLGIIPDILVCRSENPLDSETKSKLAAFCHVGEDAVVSAHDVSNLYQIPISLNNQSVLAMVSNNLGFSVPESLPMLDDWKAMADKFDMLENEVRIAMVGKYTGLSDSYLSVIKALQHSALAVNRKLVIDWIESTNLDPIEKTGAHDDAWETLKAACLLYTSPSPRDH